MNSITKPSRRLALLFQVVFFVYPLAMLGLWLWFDPTGAEGFLGVELLKPFMRGHAIQSIVMWQRLGCFGASMLSGVAVMYVFLSLSRLFNLYGAGEFFSAANVACYRAIGVGLMVQQLVSLPEGALQTLMLSWTNPEGQRFIAVGMDEVNVSLVLVGFMVILISRIMDEGRKLQEEQQLTV